MIEPTSPQTAPGMLEAMVPRVATALILGVVILSAAAWGGLWGWAALWSLVSAGCALEFFALSATLGIHVQRASGVAAAAALPLAAASGDYLAALAVVACLLVVLVGWRIATESASLVGAAVTVFGALYTGLTLAHMVALRHLGADTATLIVVLISVWSNDVFAYLIGSPFGRHRLAPAISPRKSWEGFGAGSLASITTWGIASYLGLVQLAMAPALLLGVFTALAVVGGDLVESRFKREAQIKDSGRALPGHGGFLDRFDSMIAVSVVAFWFLHCAGTV